MKTEQRDKIESMKEQRATLKTPVERILFDNDPRNGTFAERIVAMTESADEREP